MSEIVEKYKEYNPTTENTTAVIQILAGELSLPDWEIMKVLVLEGEYISPSEAVTKKSKETSTHILEDIIEHAKLKGYEDTSEFAEIFKRSTKKVLNLVREILKL